MLVRGTVMEVMLFHWGLNSIYFQNRMLKKRAINTMNTILIKKNEKNVIAVSGQSCVRFTSKWVIICRKKKIRLLGLLSMGFVKALFIIRQLNYASML